MNWITLKNPQNKELRGKNNEKELILKNSEGLPTGR